MASQVELDRNAEKVWYLIPSLEEALRRFNAAGILPIASSPPERVLLGYHRHHGPEGKILAWGWGNPAGKREGDETAWQTAVRETKEEFGIDCPKTPPHAPLVMAVYDDTIITPGTLDIGVCYPVPVDPAVVRPEEMNPTAEVETFRWFGYTDLGALTDYFTDPESLWGGCWTEFVLLRWWQASQAGNNYLERFPGMITFPRYTPGRWLTSYEKLKSKPQR